MQYDKDMQSPHWALFLAAREVLLAFDGIKEVRKDRITTYSDRNGGICHMRTMPHGIDIGFLKGAKLRDVGGVLTGKGKVMRVLPLSRLDEMLISGFVQQAIVINGS